MPDERRIGDRRLKDQKRAFLSDDEQAFATVLVALLIDHFGSVAWFDWEPDVLGQEVEDDFGVKMPLSVRDRLWALVSSLTTDLFYSDAMFFNHVCNALSGGPVPMQEFEPAELDEVAWGVTEIMLNDHQGDDFEKFQPEIQIYAGQVLAEEDLKPFPPMDWATDMGGGEAYDITDDPSMVSAKFKDRDDRKTQIQQMIADNLRLLHHQLDRLNIQADQRKMTAEERRRSKQNALRSLQTK